MELNDFANLSRRAVLGGTIAIALAAATKRQQPSAVTTHLGLDEERRLERIYLHGFQAARGTAPSPRGRKIEAYLANVGSKLTALPLRRKVDYSFHFDA